jgi:hypothetical protein
MPSSLPDMLSGYKFFFSRIKIPGTGKYDLAGKRVEKQASTTLLSPSPRDYP